MKPDSESSKQGKKKVMELGQTCSFRPKDPELVEMFNLALTMTGWELTELLGRSIRHGLESAVKDWQAEQQALEEKRRAAAAQFHSRLSGKTKR